MNLHFYKLDDFNQAGLDLEPFTCQICSGSGEYEDDICHGCGGDRVQVDAIKTAFPDRIKIQVDPELPESFDECDNSQRPESHIEWWFKPFVITVNGGYMVRCLDGGAWDRPSVVG